MSQITDFSDLVKTKIMEQIPVFENNLKTAVYPTIEQTQLASGTLNALQSVYNSMENVLAKFTEQNPNIENLAISEFVPFLKNEIENAGTEIKGLTSKNAGLYQGFFSLADSLAGLSETFLQQLDAAKPSLIEASDPHAAVMD